MRIDKIEFQEAMRSDADTVSSRLIEMMKYIIWTLFTSPEGRIVLGNFIRDSNLRRNQAIVSELAVHDGEEPSSHEKITTYRFSSNEHALHIEKSIILLGCACDHIEQQIKIWVNGFPANHHIVDFAVDPSYDDEYFVGWDVVVGIRP
jgi:hypothetical protein